MEDEPEPCPAAKGSGRVRVSCQKELNEHISLIMQAHFQLLQLAADAACVSCYFSTCAPFFLKLAESAKIHAGTLIDTIIHQGGSVELPAIPPPCPNLAMDIEQGEQTLPAALEAAIQVEISKGLEDLSKKVQGHGTAEIRKVADALSIESRRIQTELMKLLSTAHRSQTKLEVLSHVRLSMTH